MRHCGVNRAGASALAFVCLLAAGCGPGATPAATPTAVRMRLTTAPSPPRVGRAVEFVLSVASAEGRPVTGAQARLELTMATMDMGTIAVALKEESPGRYAGAGTIPMGGDWNCRASVQGHQVHAERLFHLHAE